MLVTAEYIQLVRKQALKESRDDKSPPLFWCRVGDTRSLYCLAFCCQNVQSSLPVTFATVGRSTYNCSQCLVFNCCTFSKCSRGNDRSRSSCTNHKVGNIRNTTIKKHSLIDNFQSRSSTSNRNIDQYLLWSGSNSKELTPWKPCHSYGITTFWHPWTPSNCTSMSSKL